MYTKNRIAVAPNKELKIVFLFVHLSLPRNLIQERTAVHKAGIIKLSQENTQIKGASDMKILSTRKYNTTNTNAMNEIEIRSSRFES